jgi:N-succinyldiaminopimelate aminotransferase
MGRLVILTFYITKGDIAPMPRIANRVAHQEPSVFGEINEIAAQFPDTINLGQGRPDFDGPKEIMQAAADAILTGKANQYAPDLGVKELRQSIALHAQSQYGLEINQNGGIVVTSGAAEGVFVALMGVVNEGDEVILIEPYFDTYLQIIEAAGAKPVFVPMRPPAWTFDPEELRAAFTDKTTAIVINTPHNPTGRVYTMEEMTHIADLCKEFDVVVVSDEVYEHLIFDNARHIPMATLPDMFERTLTVSSGAKTFSATGWKIGWVMGHPDLVEGPWRIHQSVTFAVNHPSQYGIAKGLSLGNNYYEELQAIYSRKREILRQGLVAAGITVDYAPDGAFYIMGNFSGVFDGDDREFAKWLIREHGVACIPPSAFFTPSHRHITRHYARFAYCKSDELLYRAMERLAKLKG